MDIGAQLKSMLTFWDRLETTQQEKLKKSAVVRRFQRGETFHRGSETCSGLYIVMSGQVRVYLLSESGREITLYRLFERDLCLFSASCIMSDVQFDVYVQAEKDTEAILIPTAVYEWLMDHSIHVARYTNSLMASRFSDVMWLLEQILFKSFDSRLSAFLMEQSVIEQSADLYLTHEEIARHLGTAREVVTRMLNYFQSEGLVSLARGVIHLKDTDRLDQLAK